MKYYLAPMEGLTTYVFRNAYHRHFTPVDKYFTPFIVPHTKKDFNARERKELDAEHNAGKYVVPQILTNNSEDFVRTSGFLRDLGYQEVNLNLGCPSKTVVSKKRGAGFLEDPDCLDRFLEEVFTGRSDMRISIKTRLGMESPEEFEDILEVYNRYPLCELIIHPRVQKDYYKNPVNRAAFAEYAADSRNSVCYNGDLFTESDIRHFREEFPQVECVMLGRGILSNPALLSGEKPTKEQLMAFHGEILEGYQEICSGDRTTLFKLKEFWSYLISCFPEEKQKKLSKKIRKCEKLEIYRNVVAEVFAQYH